MVNKSQDVIEDFGREWQSYTQEALSGQELAAAFDERRRIIVSELNQIPGFRCADAGGAFYAFPNIEGTGLSAREAQDRFLEEAGVATIAGTSFGAWGEGYLRFSYANSIENIREAIRRIRACL